MRAWLTGRAIALHATVVVVVVSFLLLARWQLHRAESGNGLSWAYVFEWPIFAGYAVYMWWRLLHDDEEKPPPPPTAKEVEELEAYNRYLAGLKESGKRGTWR